MRILHILTTPRAEGTPNLVLDWLSAGQHLSIRQSVLALHNRPADLTLRLRESSDWYAEHQTLSLGKGKFFAIRKAVSQAASEVKPDLLVCWPTGFANWVCSGARRAGVTNLLVHAGNPPNRGFRADWISRYCMWPLQIMNANVICCSDYVRDELRAIPFISQKMFHTVWNCARINGVSERASTARAARLNESIDGSRPTITMVATLEHHKDHVTLLKAIPDILNRISNVRIRLVGDGSRREELQQLTRQLQIDQAVEFLGTRDDVPEILGSSDLFVLSTTPQEGLGTVLLEAMAAGLPIIASDVPACRETLQGGRWGKLVRPSDPPALATVIIAHFQEQSPAFDSDEQIRFASSFTPERMIQCYLEIAAGVS